jgi:hypothetical protein
MERPAMADEQSVDSLFRDVNLCDSFEDAGLIAMNA